MSVAAAALASTNKMTTTTGIICDETHEHLSKWRERWNEHKLGWHKSDVNEALLKYDHVLFPPTETTNNNDEDTTTTTTTTTTTCIAPNTTSHHRVFVPLCGKSVDLAHLARHDRVRQVVGLDGIGRALDEFVAEHVDLEIRTLADNNKSSTSMFECREGNSIRLVKGDFFDLQQQESGVSSVLLGGPVDAVWDRASLVAIQPDLRESYVDIMGKLLKPGGSILLATLERRTGTEEAIKAGPPFSVPESEVRRLYEGQDWVESVTLLEEVDEFERSPENKERFSGMGMSSFFELIFEIKAKKNY